MKSWTNHIILCFVLLSIIGCRQQKKAEVAFMDCVYKNLIDYGANYKELMKEYESLLISEKILNDTTASSYWGVVVKMSMDESYNPDPSTSLLNLTKKYNFPNQIEFDCERKILNNSIYNTDKMTELNRVIDSIIKTKNPQPHNFAQGMFSVLNEEDFQLDYYKLSVFALVALIRTDIGINY